MGQTNPRARGRLRRQKHVRKHVQGTSGRPRLSVFRSNSQIYAQVIDDGRLEDSGRTIAAASSLDESLRGKVGEMKKSELAGAVGELIAARCVEKDIKEVVFDRNGFLYHGRVRALADGARKGGLVF